MSLGVFGRKIKVVAHFRLQISISFHNPYSRHVEVVVFLLEGWRTKSHSIAGTQRQIAQWSVADVELGSEMRLPAVREIVVAQSSYHFPLVGHAPVVLRKPVPCVLLACFTVKMGVVQIVVHIVGANGEHVAIVQRMVVEHSYRILHIAVITHIQSGDALIIRLVVLVESIACLQLVSF